MGEVVEIRPHAKREQIPLKLVRHIPQGSACHMSPAEVVLASVEARVSIAMHTDALAAQIARLMVLHGDVRPEVSVAGIEAVKALDAFAAAVSGADKPSA